MELTPRTSARPTRNDHAVGGDVADDDVEQVGTGDQPGGLGASRAGEGGRRRWLPLLIVGAMLVTLGVVVARGLSEATVYFLNADEAADQREELGERRFRLQGTVTEHVTDTSDGVSFGVVYNGVTVTVRHVGDPPQMFRPGIPVVLEGNWDDSASFFASDRLLVRHDEEYKANDEYDERIAEAEAEGAAVDAPSEQEGRP